MPSSSPAQARLMAAVSHGWRKPGGGGPPVSVAKEFNQADKGSGIMNKGYNGKVESYAQGGAVLGRTKEFIKTADRFRDQQYKPAPKTDDVFGKGIGHGVGDSGHNKAPEMHGKSLSPVKPKC